MRDANASAVAEIFMVVMCYVFFEHKSTVLEDSIFAEPEQKRAKDVSFEVDGR